MVLACHVWMLLRQYPLTYAASNRSSSTYCSLWKCLPVNLAGSESASSALVLQLYNINDTLNSCSPFNHISQTVVGGSGFCSVVTFDEICFFAFLTLMSAVYIRVFSSR